MPPARQRAPAPWRRPLCKSLLWCEAISVGEKSQGGCVGSWGQPLISAPTAAQTPAGASQPLSWHPPSFGPAITTCPHLAVPLTRGFGDSFRDDEPQRGGMGHGRQDRLSVARGWFPSIFSISTACTHWLQRGQVPKYLLSKSSPGVCLSAGMPCSGHRMPSARNTCYRHFQLRLDTEMHVAR